MMQTLWRRLRVCAMKESLEAIGHFDPLRARERFLSNFVESNTMKVLMGEKLVAFYVVTELEDCLYLDHLYVHPDYQGEKLGSQLLQRIIDEAKIIGKSIRLGALRGSRSNNFYRSHGFIQTHEDEFDIYYELNINSRLKT